MIWFLRSIAFVAGAIAGAAALLFGLLAWPFPHASRTERTMPVFLKGNPDAERFRLLLPQDVISLATSSDPAIMANVPSETQKLPEANVRDGLALIVRIRDARERPIGFATELEAGHEASRLIDGKIMTHTTWTVLIPGRGALFLYQVEDNWVLFKRFILPGFLLGRPWHGRWNSLNTLGPSPEGYGEIIAGTGAFAGAKGHFVEFAELRGFTVGQTMEGKMDLLVAPAR